MIKRMSIAIVLATGASVLATPSFAGDRPYGRVTDVEPIYKKVKTSTPREQCWDEKVPVTHGGHKRSYTGPIVGAIIGGALGNELGHKKKNKQIGTAVGAVLGASIGNDISRRHHRPRRVSYETHTECRTVYDDHWHQEVVGYNVTYRYRGDRFHTQMPYHPGKRIPLHVEVTPVFDRHHNGNRHAYDQRRF